MEPIDDWDHYSENNARLYWDVFKPVTSQQTIRFQPSRQDIMLGVTVSANHIKVCTWHTGYLLNWHLTFTLRGARDGGGGGEETGDRSSSLCCGIFKCDSSGYFEWDLGFVTAVSVVTNKGYLSWKVWPSTVWWSSRDIVTCVCGDQNRYFKRDRVVFLTLTLGFLCLNLTGS